MRKHGPYGLVLILLMMVGLDLLQPHGTPATAAEASPSHPVASAVRFLAAVGRPGVLPRVDRPGTAAGPALRPVDHAVLTRAASVAVRTGTLRQQQEVRFLTAVQWQQDAALLELHDLQVLAQATPPAPVPGAAPTRAPAVTGGGAGGAWAALRQCESGGNYAEDTGNGYYGAYQFSLATWQGLGYPGYPNQAPPAVQDAAAQQLQARSGWGQWPACSAKLGL